jgi:hypothetical protein
MQHSPLLFTDADLPKPVRKETYPKYSLSPRRVIYLPK